MEKALLDHKILVYLAMLKRRLLTLFSTHVCEADHIGHIHLYSVSSILGIQTDDPVVTSSHLLSFQLSNKWLDVYDRKEPTTRGYTHDTYCSWLWRINSNQLQIMDTFFSIWKYTFFFFLHYLKVFTIWWTKSWIYCKATFLFTFASFFITLPSDSNLHASPEHSYVGILQNR